MLRRRRCVHALDGDTLLCGCSGMVSMDSETPPWINNDEECPEAAACNQEVPPEQCVEPT